MSALPEKDRPAGGPPAQPRPWIRGWAALAAAAVLGAVVAGGAVLWWSQARSLEADRAGAAAIRPLVPAGEPLPRRGCRLRWTGPAGAVYDLVVAAAGERREPVAEARGLLSAEFRIPDAALAALAPGTVLRWRVGATLPDGRRLRSPIFVHPLE